VGDNCRATVGIGSGVGDECLTRRMFGSEEKEERTEPGARLSRLLRSIAGIDWLENKSKKFPMLGPETGWLA